MVGLRSVVERLAELGFEANGKRIGPTGPHGRPAWATAELGGVETGFGFDSHPPEQRRHGWATALVSALTAKARTDRHRCILYADLGNPTSNSIYRAIGYQAVEEVLRYDFRQPR